MVPHWYVRTYSSTIVVVCTLGVLEYGIPLVLARGLVVVLPMVLEYHGTMVVRSGTRIRIVVHTYHGSTLELQ